MSLENGILVHSELKRKFAIFYLQTYLFTWTVTNAYSHQISPVIAFNLAQIFLNLCA